jgi:WhiB family redox-sensing transcriptional regulator
MNDRWRELAVCRDRDAALWMADGRTDEGVKAKAICFGCPVRAECAAQALDYLDRNRMLFGVWAGVTASVPSARTQLRRLATGA